MSARALQYRRGKGKGVDSCAALLFFAPGDVS